MAGKISAMKRSLIFAPMLVLALGLIPSATLAQTDQPSTAPVATDTAAPGATVNPMDTNAPAVNTYSTTSSNSGNTGWWGLIGLIGLLGLFGARRDRTTTIT
jgi:uncharacterized protein (TIGR03382 family)